MIALALRRQRAALRTEAGVVVLGAIALVALSPAAPGDVGGYQLLVLLLPLLIGLITGTTVFARRLDRGEHVFTLTQGARRTAWWGSTLGAAAIATALGAGALSLVTSTIARSLVAAPAFRGLSRSPLDLPWFETSGIVVVALALFACSIAATVGLLTRSTLAAVVIAMIGYFLVMPALDQVRTLALPPEVATGPVESFASSAVPGSARIVSYEYADGSGRPIADSEVMRLCGVEPDQDCVRRTGAEASLVRYQPASRYWPFQLIESALLLALSALVVAAGAAGLNRATRP
jgi:hypothetical protein